MATKVFELLVKSKVKYIYMNVLKCFVICWSMQFQNIQVQKTFLYSIHSNSQQNLQGCPLQESIYMESFLKVLVSLVRLEEQVKVCKGELLHENLPREFESLYDASLHQQKNDHLVFLTGHSIVYQPLLLSSVVQSLSSPPSPLHHMWIKLVENLMGHLNKASSRILPLVILLIIQHLQQMHSSHLQFVCHSFYKN